MKKFIKNLYKKDFFRPGNYLFLMVYNIPRIYGDSVKEMRKKYENLIRLQISGIIKI